tara:strand:- start:127 stop:333 length:207 start_codon:yes stop_codon:yes gene_type:complete
MVTLQETLNQTYEWSLDRIKKLNDQNMSEDADALRSEFRDWLDRDSESDVLSLEYIEDFHEGDTIIEI